MPLDIIPCRTKRGCILTPSVNTMDAYGHGQGIMNSKLSHHTNTMEKRGRDEAMNLNKSIDFLLDNAGPVIQYRLRKEILNNINKAEEEILLEEIYQLPYFKLLLKYIKANGYIGRGMHSWDNWRGEILHETPLQDGETAARLLSYYAVPKIHPIVKNFVTAMRDDRHEVESRR